MNRKLIKRMLKQMNLPYLEASDGKQAMHVMLEARNYTNDTNDPQVGMVLMDLSMPVMNGFEATQLIRTYRHFQDLPIVGLTAAAVEDGRERCLQIGMTEYQTKPIKRDQLFTVCQRYLVDHQPVTPKAPRDTLPNVQDLLV